MRKTAALRARRLTAEAKARGITESYEQLNQTESITWLLGAMAPIDPKFTKDNFAQSERVKGCLAVGLSKHGLSPSYEYQGSASNDTHIRAYSDIDLLILEERFFWLEAPQESNSPYDGNPVDALVELRRCSIDVVRGQMPQVTIDESGAKSVSLSGGELTLKVDLVTAGWWNTNQYNESPNKTTRGVKVLDYLVPKTINNKPFLHNALIDEKDSKVNGNMRRVARLLKSLKYDADKSVSISSYDIVAIAYNIPNEKLLVPRGAHPLLAANCSEFLDRLENDKALRESIWVPNRMRKVFCDEGAKLQGLRELKGELKQLLYEVQNDLTRSMRKLAEARLVY